MNTTTDPPPPRGILSLPIELLQILRYNLYLSFRIDSTMHTHLCTHTLNMLFINKTLRSLALQVYYSENTFSLWPTRDIFCYPSPGTGKWVRTLVINLPLSDVTKRFTDSFITRQRNWEVSVGGLPRLLESRTPTTPEDSADGNAVSEISSPLTQLQTYYPLLKVVQFSFREGPCLNEKGKESFKKLPSEAVIRLSPVKVIVTCKSRWACEKTGCQEDCLGLIERSIKSMIRLRDDEG